MMKEFNEQFKAATEIEDLLFKTKPVITQVWSIFSMNFQMDDINAEASYLILFRATVHGEVRGFGVTLDGKIETYGGYKPTLPLRMFLRMLAKMSRQICYPKMLQNQTQDHIEVKDEQQS